MEDAGWRIEKGEERFAILDPRSSILDYPSSILGRPIKNGSGPQFSGSAGFLTRRNESADKNVRAPFWD